MTKHRKERAEHAKQGPRILAPFLEVAHLIISARILYKSSAPVYEGCILCIFTAFDGIITHLLWAINSEEHYKYFEKSTADKYKAAYEVISGSKAPQAIVDNIELLTAVRNEIAHPFPYNARTANSPRSGLERLVDLGVWKDYRGDVRMIDLTRFSTDSIANWCWEICHDSIDNLARSASDSYNFPRITMSVTEFIQPEEFRLPKMV